MRRAVLISFLAFTAITPARAELVTISQAVPGHPGKTYADLVRLFVPDLVVTGEMAHGETIVPLRHIAEGNGGRPPLAVDLHWIDAVPFRGQGRDGTLILVDLGQSDDRIEATAILAYFDETLRLVDAVDVGMGPRVYLGTPFRISHWDDAAPIQSNYSNSIYSINLLAPAFLHNGRFQQIDQWTVSSSNDCGWTQQQEAAFTTEPVEGDGYWPVTVSIAETIETDILVSCPNELPQAGTATGSVTYRWDGKRERYVPDNDALRKFIESRPVLN